ncbi:MAG: hypothetical protein IIY93_13105, partial [Clostridia bacterium]|nr:hypothetical protein [Clostridia bacterium]
MTIIQSLKEYFESYAPDINVLGVDFLGDNIGSMVIEAVPCDPIVTEYLDGSTERQYLFVIGGREFYSEEVWQGIENAGVYEQLQNWLLHQTRGGVLPVLDGGREATSLSVTGSAYIQEADEP